MSTSRLGSSFVQNTAGIHRGRPPPKLSSTPACYYAASAQMETDERKIAVHCRLRLGTMSQLDRKRSPCARRLLQPPMNRSNQPKSHRHGIGFRANQSLETAEAMHGREYGSKLCCRKCIAWGHQSCDRWQNRTFKVHAKPGLGSHRMRKILVLAMTVLEIKRDRKSLSMK